MAPYIGYDSDTTFIPGTLNTSSSLTIQGGGITQTGGDVNFDSGTLFIDEDQNRVGIGTSAPTTKLDVFVNGGEGLPTVVTGERMRIISNDLASRSGYLSVITGSSAYSGIFFGDKDAADVGKIRYYHADNSLQFLVNGTTEGLRVASTGNIGIGTSNPTERVHIYSNYALTENSFTRRVGIYNNVERQTASDSYAAASIFGTYNSYIQVPPLNTSASVFSVTGTRNDVGIYVGSVTGTVYGNYNSTTLGPFSGTVPVSVGDVISVYNELTVGNQANTITNAYGMRNILTIYPNATITNHYGIHLSRVSTGTITNNWSIYSSDSASKMYHAGNIGIGTTDPTSRLHIHDVINTSSAYGLRINIKPDANNVTKTGIYIDATRPGLGTPWIASGIEIANDSYAGLANGLKITSRAFSSGGQVNAINAIAQITDTNAGGGLATAIRAEILQQGSSGVLSPTYAAQFLNNATSGSFAYGVYIKTVAGASSVVPFEVDHGTSELFRIASDGNVGIGATNPQGKLDVNGNVIPTTDAVHNLGSSTKRWANIYSADLQLSNEGSSNDIDGTWGAYTIQEGEENLYLINRRSGKKFKFILEEVE